MDHRPLGRTDMPLSTVGLGTWKVGPVWDDVSDEQARDGFYAIVGG